MRRHRRHLPPITVPMPRECCRGWYFAHTDDCATPTVPRPCSDCGAEPGTDHYPHICTWTFDDDLDPDNPDDDSPP